MFFPYNLMFHTCCVIFRPRIFDLCTLAPKVRVREYIFPLHVFFVARIARTPSLFFVNIMKDNTKMLSYLKA